MERGARQVENLVISSAFWRGRRVFVTGHTGFKGAWLSLMLSRLNALTRAMRAAAPEIVIHMAAQAPVRDSDAEPIWARDRDSHPHEAPVLRLDTAKARETLGFAPLLDFAQAVAWTAQWGRGYAEGRDAGEMTLEQIDRYLGQRVRLASPFAPDAMTGAKDDRRSRAG